MILERQRILYLAAAHTLDDLEAAALVKRGVSFDAVARMVEWRRLQESYGLNAQDCKEAT